MEDNLAKLTTRSENNEFLMLLLIREGVSGKNLAWLNKCCLYLQVITLAHIITDEGNYIYQSAWKGE